MIYEYGSPSASPAWLLVTRPLPRLSLQRFATAKAKDLSARLRPQPPLPAGFHIARGVPAEHTSYILKGPTGSGKLMSSKKRIVVSHLRVIESLTALSFSPPCKFPTQTCQ